MSWVEVEAKIKVANPKNMRRRISAFAKRVCKKRKVDDYYTLQKDGYPKKSLRVRSEGGKHVVNFKQHINYVGGIHAKKETEFETTDTKGFFSLLKEFGFRRWVTKDKKSDVYRYKGVSIELNYVKRLGWYVEIEMLVPKSKVSKARKKIQEIMKKLEIKRGDIEKRGYTKELYDLK